MLEIVLSISSKLKDIKYQIWYVDTSIGHGVPPTVFRSL